MVLAFPLIGNWIAWKIGNGRSVRLGEDPWVGAREDHKFPISVITHLKDQICFKLADMQVHQPIPQGRTRWKNAQELQLEGKMLRDGIVMLII